MSGLRFSESKLGEGKEIGVYCGDELSAVITHPCPGADWFVHERDFAPRRRFKTRKAALAFFQQEQNDE